MDEKEMGRRYRQIGLMQYYQDQHLCYQELVDKIKIYMDNPLFISINYEDIEEINKLLASGKENYELLLENIVRYEALIWVI